MMRGQAQALSSARGAGSGSDEWQTPVHLLERVRRIGAIGLDPCTSSNNPVGADEFFTKGQDGLAQSWSCAMQICWVNSPYSKMSTWAEKAVAEAERGVRIVMLVAARPDTRWWRSLWDAADAVAFWRGRLRFVGAPAPAPFPSALIGLNLSQRRFRQAFGDVAEIVLPT